MVIPEEAEVKEAAAAEEALLAPLSRQQCHTGLGWRWSLRGGRERRAANGRSILLTGGFELTNELLSFLELTGRTTWDILDDTVETSDKGVEARRQLKPSSLRVR